MRQTASWRFFNLQILAAMVCLGLASCGGGGSSSSTTPTAQSSTIQLSTSALAFSTQMVNTTSSPQTVTLTNSGTDTLSISSIGTSGDFSQSNNCGSTLAPNTSCTASVTFTPTSNGTRSGYITVRDNAKGNPHKIGLSGSGSAPVATFSPSSLTFASQQPNTTSAAQTVTLTNSGTVAMSISYVKTSGDFAQTNNCGLSLAISASCTINITFTPTASGTRTGNLSVADSASGSPQQVPLTGTGAGSTAPVVSLSSSSLTFGSQQLNVISAAQTVTVSNTGNASLSITSVTASGDFSQTNNCGSSLAAGSSCSVQVSFYPTATGTRTGTLSIADNASGSPQSVSLSGTGATAGSLVPSTASLAFGTVSVGQSSTKTLNVANTGGQTITVSSVGTTGSGVSVSGVSVPFSVASGQSVSMNVTFAPTSASTVSGSVYFINNSPSTNVSVAVTGTGAAVQHQVTVQWAAPSTTVLGYYAYRSTVSGGPYTRISSLDTTTNYVDQAVTAGDTYYYVITSVSSSNVESTYSNEAAATVPLP